MTAPNWKNHTIWTGDNLPIMRGLNSESVDLIYLDPPFNSNKNYAAPIGSEAAGAAFKDTWTLDDVDRLWLLLLKDKDPVLYHVIEGARLVHGNGMASYLSMMAQRLWEMKRVLKPTGSIYLHCDPTASHYLKLLMDAVLGRRNFRSEITWRRTTSHNDAARTYGFIGDSILFYTKSTKWNFNRQYTPYSKEYIERIYRYVDKDGRRYCTSNIRSPGPRPNLTYEYKGYQPHPNGWTISREKMEQYDAEGRLHFPKRKNGRLRLKLFLDDMPGVPMGNIWDDIKPVQSQAKQRVGYPTQKPIALLERIIQVSSNEGDIVFDPFCGCATACVASERHHRHWLGIDISEKADELVQARIRKEIDLFHNFKSIHRTDQPQRTDLGKLPPPSAHKDLLYGKQSGQCGGCVVSFHKRNLTMDHIVPRADGGTDHIENLWLLCGACNSSKGTKSQAEFLKERVKRGESIEWLL